MTKHNPHGSGSINLKNQPLTLGRLDTIHRQMARTAVSAPWATVRPRKVYELNGIEIDTKWYDQQERVQRTWERCYECSSVIYPHETHLQINDKNITDHLHAKESPVARSNMWPNGPTNTDTRPSYSILHSTRLSKQDDTRALTHNPNLRYGATAN